MVEREARDHIVGKHRVLAAWHIGGGKPLARDRIERRARRDAECRRGDMDAHAQRSGFKARHREGIVDFGRAHLVEAKGRDWRERQILWRGRHGVPGKVCAARKELVQKAPEVVLMRVGKQAAALEEPRRAEAGIVAGLLERARLRLVAVRRIQQLVLQRGDLGGAFEARERLRP